MLDEIHLNAEVDYINISHIIKLIYHFIDENKNSSDVFAYEDPELGKVSYEIIGNEIKILFTSIKKEFLILKHYMYLVNAKKKKNKILIFTKTGLENAFKTFKGRFFFLIDNKIINSTKEILDLFPQQVILRNKNQVNCHSKYLNI